MLIIDSHQQHAFYAAVAFAAKRQATKRERAAQDQRLLDVERAKWESAAIDAFADWVIGYENFEADNYKKLQTELITWDAGGRVGDPPRSARWRRIAIDKMKFVKA